MAISYNTGATGAGTTTIPAGVLSGDVMLLVVNGFSNGTSPVVSVSSTGTAFTQIGGQQAGGTASGYTAYGAIFYAVASGTDAGKVITSSVSGGGAPVLATALAAYTGASSLPVDVSGGAASGTSPLAFPAETTGYAGDWAIYLSAPGDGSGGLTGPSGTTQRQLSNPAFGVYAGIWDGNGSAGAAGSSIGGGSFTVAASGTPWLTTFTIGLAAPGNTPPVAVEAPTPPRIPHPLWWELLEVAAQRADWQAQGVATPAAFHWRLMDGVNGRPGSGPGTATSNAGNLVTGTQFYVTASGMWFEGYWWWVCPAGSQPTAPQKFALWSAQSSGAAGTVVPGSVVTSGTLTSGWNYIPLAKPVQLALYGCYTAATGVNGNYPGTASQFGSGQPYSAGIVNGPLAAFSDTGASNVPPSGGQGASITSGSDPSRVQPVGNGGTSDNFWVDVQVTNIAPATYQGSYRLWPNMADADFATSADAAVNYVIGTEITLSQPSVINAVWYYIPAGQGGSGNQWATSADIWNVRTGVRVATQQAPVWLKPFTGGVDGNSNSGRWVYTQLPGTVTLQPGDYYVTVYNGNGSPNGWGAKRLGYWEPYNQSPTGSYQNAAAGAAGITSGPLYAPPTPLASGIQDYEHTATVEPGQSVFAVGPPNQFPNRYVGGSSGGGTGPNLFQNYWVDLEVTPAATWTPDAPDLPQRLPHPLYTRLLEDAAYRADWGAPPPLAPASGAASLTAASAVNAPALTQREETGTALAAAASLTAPDGVTGAPATIAAVSSVTTAAAQLAGASLAAASSVSTLATQLATASLAAASAVTDAAVQGAGATIGAVSSVTTAGGAQGAASLNPAAVLLAGSAQQGSAATLAAASTVNAADVIAAAVATLAAASSVNAADAAIGAPASLAAASVLTTASAPGTGSAVLAAVSVLAAIGTPAGSFTVGVLTAAVAAGGAGGFLTASDQRTGGPA